MKKTPLKRGTKQMKRSGFKQKITKPMKRTRLRVVGHSTVSDLKRDIQELLRQICLIRDKQCILHGIKCNHEVGMEGVVWQAEHLIERSNSATYADPRLVVLICRNCHYWKHIKNSNHSQYDKWVRYRLSKERVELWDACSDAIGSSHMRMGAYDWNLAKVALVNELNHLLKNE